MKDLVKGFVKWLIIVLATLTIVTWGFILTAYCQIKPPPYIFHENHDSVEDMEEDIRFKSIFLLYTEPTQVYWKKEMKNRVDTGMFKFDDRTQINPNPPKGCYVALYCVTHEYLYALYPCKGG